ncbi:MAG TPA: methyltransferase [Melioribacteraceae bacterium]|nr:methyltransferase [Melioribacteraceae bacterium]
MNLPSIIQVFLFASGTILLITVSRKSFRSFKVHGFYRFFVFEFTLILVLLNIPHWFSKSFSPRQILSWFLLLISLYLIIRSISLLKKTGGSNKRENATANFEFENTDKLVKDGVYKYIRHPMYSSLLFLCLGALLKNISVLTILLTVFIMLFLIVTAKVEERENINYFGKSYSEYIKETGMFVPFIF